MEEAKRDVKVIPAPQTAVETGVSSNLLEDLAIKILFLHGEMSLHDLTRHTGLSFAVVHELFDRLRKQQFVEVKGMVGLTYRTALTDRGRGRALELLSLNQYAGFAPVSLKEYTSRVRAQTVSKADVHASDLLPAFENLVIDPGILERLEPPQFLALRFCSTALPEPERQASLRSSRTFTAMRFSSRMQWKSQVRLLLFTIRGCTKRLRPAPPMTVTVGGCCAAGPASW